MGLHDNFTMSMSMLVSLALSLILIYCTLSLQARGGHNEAARYLIARGADVTAVDENGDTALTVAKSPSMVRLLKGKPGGLFVGWDT